MTTNNYLVLARDQEQQKFWKILAGAVGGSLLLHAIAAVIFNLLPQPALDNSVEVTLVDSSELPPDFPSSPTPSVKIKLDRTPVPVKIINRPSKSQPLPIQQTTELFSKPSLGIIATNPSPAAQPNGSKIEGKIPDPQTIVDNQTPGTTIQPSKSVVERPIASPVASEIDPNSNLGGPSQANPSQQNQSGLTNPNSAGSLFDAGSRENSEPSISIITAPGGGLDDFLASGGGTNPNNQSPNGTTLSPRKPSLPGKSGEASRTIPGNNSPSGLNSQLLPSAGNTGKKPNIVSPSSPAGSAGGSGGTSKQEIQKYFGELACLKNCKPVYPRAIVESRQVKINITLSAQGRVIKTSIAESCDHPRFDNYAEARFKEMLFQLPTGARRDFTVTMEFK